MALSDASPLNSCLHVIPRWADPGYFCGDPIDENDPLSDPMRRALSDKHSYQSIRALPLSSGGAVIFTHRILHWGNAGGSYASSSQNAQKIPPRISLAMAYSDQTFEPPYLLDAGEQLPFPDFHLRVALLCGQMIVYYQRFTFSQRQLLFFKKCFDRYQDRFHSSYREKVVSEFSSAVMEGEQGVAMEGTDRIVNEEEDGSEQGQSSDNAEDYNYSDDCSDAKYEEESDEEDEDSYGALTFGTYEDDDEDAVEAALDCLIDMDNAERDKIKKSGKKRKCKDANLS